MKKILNCFTILAVLAMGLTFFSCSNGSGSSSSGGGGGDPVEVPVELQGTWTGTAVRDSAPAGFPDTVTLDLTITASGYTVIIKNSSGTRIESSAGIFTKADEDQIKGRGSDHSFTGTKQSSNSYSVTVKISTDIGTGTYTGLIAKV